MRYYFENITDQEKAIFEIELTHASHNSWSFALNNHQTMTIRKVAEKYYVTYDGISWRKIATPKKIEMLTVVADSYKIYRGYMPSGANKASPGSLITQMPGKVVKVNAKVGDRVEVGQTLLILEAMKMENEIKTSVAGTIKSLHVSVGMALESGHLMIEIEA
jgi:biotin carboxyl carrier protein